MIIVDTNVLVALTDRNDNDHQRCASWFDAVRETLLIPSLVIAEACYLIDRQFGPKQEALFLDAVGSGPRYDFQLVELIDRDVRRMAELVQQYADLRFGGTDASVVAIAERLGITRIATMNYRHFTVVRPVHVPAFELLP